MNGVTEWRDNAVSTLKVEVDVTNWQMVIMWKPNHSNKHRFRQLFLHWLPGIHLVIISTITLSYEANSQKHSIVYGWFWMMSSIKWSSYVSTWNTEARWNSTACYLLSIILFSNVVEDLWCSNLLIELDRVEAVWHLRNAIVLFLWRFITNIFIYFFGILMCTFRWCLDYVSWIIMLEWPLMALSGLGLCHSSQTFESWQQKIYINPQWWIHAFQERERGVNPKGGGYQPIILAILSPQLHEIEKEWGARSQPFPPLDPPMTFMNNKIQRFFEFIIRAWSFVRSCKCIQR